MDSNKSENSWIPSDLDLVNDASNNFDKSTNSFFSGGIISLNGLRLLLPLPFFG